MALLWDRAIERKRAVARRRRGVHGRLERATATAKADRVRCSLIQPQDTPRPSSPSRAGRSPSPPSRFAILATWLLVCPCRPCSPKCWLRSQTRARLIVPNLTRLWERRFLFGSAKHSERRLRRGAQALPSTLPLCRSASRWQATLRLFWVIAQSCGRDSFV